MNFPHFVRTRPRLFHLTAASNVEGILQEGMLHPAQRLFADAGMAGEASVRRRDHVTVDVNGRSVLIRDQAPLHAGNMALSGGMSFEDFVAFLNGHVFFWPGTSTGPISYGTRHFLRYVNEQCRVLVFSTEALAGANTALSPLFSSYNSGSPRCFSGLRSPRSANTFLPAGEYAHTPSSVVEVVFRGSVTIPKHGVEVRNVSDFVG